LEKSWSLLSAHHWGFMAQFLDMGLLATLFDIFFLLKGDISHLLKVNGGAFTFTTLEIRATAVD
jgi:hypothetical protein